MREEDLISAFSYELRQLMKTCRVARGDRKRFTRLLRDCDSFEPDKYPECASEMVAELFDALQTFAPPYTYFGSNEGDGADYGFWPSMDGPGEMNDLPRLNADVAHLDQYWGKDVLLVNDHGNVECGRYDKSGRFHGYWSCV